MHIGVTKMNYIRISTVANRLGVSTASVYRYIRNGDFQKPIKLQANGASVWPESSIDDFIAKQRGVA